ncbi:MAG: VWA domain-containing protein [Nitrososphaeraceae archaeon]|nr:VWA domain-containing protein [Nitrososphaeraceae archaeon]MDW0154945.1 VWA domain-containing protein [Nitrososphaeraceae archaeon]
MPTHSNNIKRFTYYNIIDFPEEREDKAPTKSIPKSLLQDFLEVLGKEIMKEDQPKLEEIEQELQNLKKEKEINQGESGDVESSRTESSIIAQLQQMGYIKDSKKWLSKKGFFAVGGKLLEDVIRALNKGTIGLHETTFSGSGSLNLDSTKKYELSDDLRLVNVPRSILNAIQRRYSSRSSIQLPIDLQLGDLEVYETKRDVSIAVVYCIDLSSTMRYSTMFGDMSRIEAAKKALWSLYLLNQKFFPSDSIHIVGFGALASKVSPYDIPYLKTFESGVGFMHYTNYQAAFRLAKKILQNEISTNRKIVLVTDGHPSACFIDTEQEKNKILCERPYSQFYAPDNEALDSVKQKQELTLDTKSGKLVYLCYRYRQVDQYIGEKTILEARKCHKLGIDIDTIMVSEEDSLLSYVNELEKYVKGRSYYINPAEIGKILITDYLNDKKSILRSN